MKPYYEDGRVTLYHGDCREILPALTADAVVTDPPYGIGFKYRTHDDNLDDWYALMDDVVPMLRAVARFVVMPSCAINRMGWWYANHPPDWLIAWHKGSPGHVAKVGFNDWEPHLVWGRPARPMHDHFKTRCGFTENDNDHPCPKPIEWAQWLVDRAAPVDGVIVDPFCGSGTTLRAAKDRGRRSIGIEMDSRYCEIAATRCAQEVLDFAA
jgi:site-specific DNA-methyltransferase (adenine-specific)